MNEEIKESFVDPDRWLKHSAIYSEYLTKAHEASVQKLAKLKAAGEDGVRVDALKLVKKLDGMAPAKAASFLRSVLEGAIIQKCMFMFQGDMLNGGSIADMFKTPEASPKAMERFKESEALQIGYDEGLQGGTADNLAAKFPAGSIELVAAIRGFKSGQEFMKKTKPEGVTPVASARGRRGGRGKNASGTTQETPEEAPEPSEVPVHNPEGDPDFDAPTPSTDDPDDGAEGEATSGPAPEIDMIAVQAMSKSEMADLWNRLPGVQKVKTFESRQAGIMRLTQAYAGQRQQGDGASAN